MISTRGRYSLRVMLDLAQHQSDGYIPMKVVANRQDISLKYLEQILPVLVKNGMIEGVHGKGGGYRLTREPQDYRIGDIINLTDNTAPVACLAQGSQECQKKSSCITLPLWQGLNDVVNEYLNSKTLVDLLQQE